MSTWWADDLRNLGLESIPAEVTSATLRSAYRRAARQAHPDAGGSDSDFKTVSGAYRRLSEHLSAGGKFEVEASENGDIGQACRVTDGGPLPDQKSIRFNWLHSGRWNDSTPGVVVLLGGALGAYLVLATSSPLTAAGAPLIPLVAIVRVATHDIRLRRDGFD